MSVFEKKATFLKVTKPQEIETDDGRKFKKSQVIVGYRVSTKNGDIKKKLAADIFGKPDFVDKKATGIKNKFEKGDNIVLKFTVESNEGKNSNYFTNVKLSNIDHADKQESDDWEDDNKSKEDDWDDNPKGSEKSNDNSVESSEDDDDMPF